MCRRTERPEKERKQTTQGRPTILFAGCEILFARSGTFFCARSLESSLSMSSSIGTYASSYEEAVFKGHPDKVVRSDVRPADYISSSPLGSFWATRAEELLILVFLARVIGCAASVAGRSCTLSHRHSDNDSAGTAPASTSSGGPRCSR